MSINTYPNLAGLYPYRIASTQSDGVLSIVARNEHWNWYLDLDGEPIYLIGNSCDTCEATFSRVRNLRTPLAPQELSRQLEQGLNTISEAVLETVLPILPKGDYVVGLVELCPTRTSLSPGAPWIGCAADYFWRRLHEHDDTGCAYELILPFVQERELNQERIAEYRSKLQQGHRPTALALSMLDNRAVSGRYRERALVHFLLDGHHKVMAASQLDQPIFLLSFLRETSLAGTPTIDYEVREYYARKVEKLTVK